MKKSDPVAPVCPYCREEEPVVLKIYGYGDICTICFRKRLRGQSRSEQLLLVGTLAVLKRMFANLIGTEAEALLDKVTKAAQAMQEDEEATS